MLRHRDFVEDSDELFFYKIPISGVNELKHLNLISRITHLPTALQLGRELVSVAAICEFSTRRHPDDGILNVC